MRRLVPLLVVPTAFGCVAPAAPTAGADPVARVVAGLLPVVHVDGEPLLHFRIADRMAHYHVPGVTIAVADHGTIAWARGFGVARAGTGDAVTTSTLFQAGSVSKPVTATATLRLVDAGRLGLDDDVNTRLRSWKVPESDLTANSKVTLRRILSHTAGTGVHGFPGYSPDAPRPTLPQILDGAPPANNKPVRVESVPGTAMHYSGGGVTIEQLLLVETTGKAFPDLARDLVLRPLGMSDSTFEQPLPPARVASAASAHDVGGGVVPGGWHVYPEMAAAGLWTTPTDLLRWALGIEAAREGKPDAILSKGLAADMLTPQHGPFGLGPHLEGEGRAFRFGHPGEDEGFLAELVYFPETGQGAAVMVNGAGGRGLLAEILEGLAAVYGWPAIGPRTIARAPQDAALLDAVTGDYEASIEAYHVTIRVRREGSRLFLTCPILGIDSEVAFTSPTGLVALDAGEELELVGPKPGVVTALRFGDFTIPRRGS